MAGIKLSQFGLAQKPVMRYWYHPESDSFFEEADAGKAMADGNAVEITKKEYDAKQAEHATNPDSLVAPAIPAVPAEQRISLGGLRLPVAPPTAQTEVEKKQDAPTPVVVAPENPEPKKSTGISLGGLRLGGDKPAVSASTSVVVTPASDAIDSDAGLSSAEGFKAKLDRLDALIIDGQDIDMLSLDTARAYVGQIMTELKTNPEYDPLLVDRDVHNIMVFVQKSTIVAGKNIAVKKEKQEVKALKKTNATFDLSGFGDNLLEAPTAVEKAVRQANSLDALAGVNVDDIETKLNR